MIKISKGLDLPISGSPSLDISDEPKVSSVALLSNDYVGMKPTMFFKEGDHVNCGEKIFEDKRSSSKNLKNYLNFGPSIQSANVALDPEVIFSTL